MEPFRQRLDHVWGEDPRDSTKALQWILSSVENGIPEDLYLDFKRKADEASPELAEPDKGNLARAISGFANTDGGIIIWGVDARSDPKVKDSPDVAQALHPVDRLTTFLTRLNALSGAAASPPLGGIENRAVPTREHPDRGYVITIVPRRSETLTQASMGKCSGQFFIRTGSGFYSMPHSFLAQLYARRPSPILKLGVALGIPGDTIVHEVLASAASWACTSTGGRKGPQAPHGECTYNQGLSIPWTVTLQNDGLATADHVVVSLAFSGFAVPAPNPIFPPEHQEGFRSSQNTKPKPNSPQTLIKLPEPLHPGQETVVTSGKLYIPSFILETQIPDLEVAGFAYATDSPSFQIHWLMHGTELKNRYFQAFRDRAQPARRTLPKLPNPLEEDE